MKKLFTFSLMIFTFLCTTATAQNGRLRTPIDRGIEKRTFIRQGQMFTGGNVAYKSLNADDYKLLVLDNMKAKAYSISGKVLGGYCWKDDIGAGLGFDYSRTMVDVPKIDLDLGDDTDISINDFYSIQQMYSGVAFLRTYLNIGNSGRFGLFNDVRLVMGGGQGKITNGLGEQMEGTYQKLFKAGLIIQPGISVFVTNRMAIEASMGIFGIRYSNTQQITNQVYKGSLNTFDASFKMNLLSVSFGSTFYF